MFTLVQGGVSSSLSKQALFLIVLLRQCQTL